MPIYEYRCNRCGHELEAIQRFSDKPLVKCPKCKKESLEKQISSGGIFIFKGEGFYNRSIE